MPFGSQLLSFTFETTTSFVSEVFTHFAGFSLSDEDDDEESESLSLLLDDDEEDSSHFHFLPTNLLSFSIFVAAGFSIDFAEVFDLFFGFSSLLDSLESLSSLLEESSTFFCLISFDSSLSSLSDSSFYVAGTNLIIFSIASLLLFCKGACLIWSFLTNEAESFFTSTGASFCFGSCFERLSLREG